MAAGVLVLREGLGFPLLRTRVFLRGRAPCIKGRAGISPLKDRIYPQGQGLVFPLEERGSLQGQGSFY